MKIFFQTIICGIAAFMAMFIGVNNSGVGSLGEWASAIFTGFAVLLALKDGRIILNAHFYFGATDSILHQFGVSRELRVSIENKSNFDVQIDGVSVLFKTKILRKTIGEYKIFDYNIAPQVIKSHNIEKIEDGFSMSMIKDPLIKYKVVRADAVIYYANRRTVIHADQLVNTDGMVFYREVEKNNTK